MGRSVLRPYAYVITTKLNETLGLATIPSLGR
jgi:hypothetical protein